MIIETKEIYKCEFCNKLYQKKTFCKRHENICKRNPDNWRACHSCKNLTTKQIELTIKDEFDGYYKERRSLIYCSKLEIFLYPPKAEKLGYKYNTTPVNNNPMPRLCDKFEFYDIDKLSEIDEFNVKRHKNEDTKTDNI